jgi:hypothetical protein
MRRTQVPFHRTEKWFRHPTRSKVKSIAQSTLSEHPPIKVKGIVLTFACVTFDFKNGQLNNNLSSEEK